MKDFFAWLKFFVLFFFHGWMFVLVLIDWLILFDFLLVFEKNGAPGVDKKTVVFIYIKYL